MSRRNEVASSKDTSSGVVTGDARGKYRFGRPGKRFWIICGTILVVFLAAYTAYLAWAGYFAPVKKPAPQQPSSTLGLLAANPSKAVQTAIAQVNAAHTASAKATAFENLGTAYLNNRQYNQAIAAYKQALSYGPQNTIIMTELSTAYTQAGQKQQAIATLQQIVILLEQSKNPADKDSIPYYQSLIQVTEKGAT